MDRRAHAIDRELVRSRVVYDAALADLFPARFELRLDQDDGLEGVPRTLPHRGDHRRQHQRGGDERHIHGYKTDPRTQIARLEVAGIGALPQAHPRIPAQSFGDLPVAGIDSDHAGRAMLQHAIGKTACGGANIRAVAPAEIDLPTGQARLPA